jgi:UDP-N-acetylmuramoyl-tripeptide--D-alanyl-D-alanine ligase
MSCQKIFSKLVGSYNKPNIEAAICIGRHFSIPFDSIRTAIENYSPDNARSQMIKRGSNTIILDAYNANPSSMEVAVENFTKIVRNSTKLLQHYPQPYTVSQLVHNFTRLHHTFTQLCRTL